MSLITISRSMGSGGSRIASLVADGLNVELYDDRRLQEEAVAMGIRSEELKSLNEKAPGFFDHVWSHKPELYLDLMESVIYEVARKGEGVIMGHGSQLLLREFGCAMHVLVHASESTRIQRMIDRHGMTRKAAERLVHKSDHVQKGFLRFAFHMDWNDPSLYDMVINTEKVGPQSAAKLIVEAAQAQEIKECSITALDAMERMSLTRRIEASLLRNDFSLTRLHVEVLEKGVAHIRGLVETEEVRSRLIDEVKGVPGVSDVQTDVIVLPATAV